MTDKNQFTLHYKEIASAEEDNILIEGISAEAVKAKKMEKMAPFAFFIRNAEGKLVGGIKGTCLYGCLNVDSLWVDPEYRNKKWGKELMHEAERLGKRKKCTFAALSTMDWEAMPFYKKLGYEVEYVRDGFDKDSKMYFLRKPLSK